MIVAGSTAKAVFTGGAAAALAGATLSLVASLSSGEFLEFVRTYGVPMALVIFFVVTQYLTSEKQRQNNDELQTEFRSTMVTHIADSNRLHEESNRLLTQIAEQTKIMNGS